MYEEADNPASSLKQRLAAMLNVTFFFYLIPIKIRYVLSSRHTLFSERAAIVNMPKKHASRR